MKLPILEVRTSTAVDAFIGFTALPKASRGKRYRLVEVADGDGDEPDIALLASMATCLRHDFGLLDAGQQIAKLADMRKLWDEVMGRGYYSPKLRGRYLAHLRPDVVAEGEVWESVKPDEPIRPTDAAIAQAFWEMSDSLPPWNGSGSTPSDLGLLCCIGTRAKEIDAPDAANPVDGDG